MTDHPEDLLSGYADNELTDDEYQYVEHHLQTCDRCKLIIAEIFELQSTIRSAFEGLHASGDMEQKVMQAIDHKSRNQAVSRGWLVLPAAAVLSLVTLWFITGPVLFKLLFMFLKSVLAVTYMVSSAAASVPMLAGSAMIISIAVVIVSVFSLRRLLRATTTEGGTMG